MADGLGTAAAALEIAKAGVELYKYIKAVWSAEADLLRIGAEVDVTAQAVQEVHRFLQTEEQWLSRDSRGFHSIEATLRACRHAFDEIEKPLRSFSNSKGSVRSAVSGIGKVKFPFKTEELELKRVNLDRLKLTLVLHLSVLSMQKGGSKGSGEKIIGLERLQLDTLFKVLEDTQTSYQEMKGALDQINVKLPNLDPRPGSQQSARPNVIGSQPDKAISASDIDERDVSQELALCAYAAAKLSASVAAASYGWQTQQKFELDGLRRDMLVTMNAVEDLGRESGPAVSAPKTRSSSSAHSRSEAERFAATERLDQRKKYDIGRQEALTGKRASEQFMSSRPERAELSTSPEARERRRRHEIEMEVEKQQKQRYELEMREKQQKARHKPERDEEHRLLVNPSYSRSRSRSRSRDSRWSKTPSFDDDLELLLNGYKTIGRRGRSSSVVSAADYLMDLWGYESPLYTEEGVGRLSNSALEMKDSLRIGGRTTGHASDIKIAGTEDMRWEDFSAENNRL